MGIVEKAKNLLVGKKGRTIVDVIKEKGFDSPVIEKIYDFSLNKFTQQTVDANKERIEQLRERMSTVEERYISSGYKESVLKESITLKREIEELENLISHQQRILWKTRDGQKMAISDEDKESLLDAIAPFKEKQNAALKDFEEKYQALKDSVLQLKSVRNETYDVARHIYGLVRPNLIQQDDFWVHQNIIRFNELPLINESLAALQGQGLDWENI